MSESEAVTRSAFDEILPGLEDPLWEGDDEAFAAYVQETFGIPASIATVTPPAEV
jgi:hypothetical protein